jgi:EAL domain-containing protein (putative c-di-GMP-specific phosphodiesterase class I)
MDVAFLAEFANGRRVFRHVDSPHPDQAVKVGGSDPLEETYCQRVVDGRLPGLIQDASQLPEARSLPVTAALPVGAHLSVPIRLKDGRIYGTFCCFSFTADTSLNQRDLAMMNVFAEIAAEQIAQELESSRLKEEMAARINAVLDSDLLSMVYQPIYHVSDRRIVGFESLSRFSTTPARSPDIWFNEAAQVDLGITLEIKATKLALQGLRHLPQSVYVAVNLSPETILAGEFPEALKSWPLERVVLEVTEHSVIEHYRDIAAVLNPLRARGLRLAVDDAGAGYASFRHILSLKPDVIKLDVSITRNIDTDHSRRALARAIISFGEETNSKVVAEGVETADELSVLRNLGVYKAQGYFIGKPAPIADAAALVVKGIHLAGIPFSDHAPRAHSISFE